MSETMAQVRIRHRKQLRRTEAEMAEAAETIKVLRGLLQIWEQRVRCPQCGQRYSERACGPAHAIVWFQVQGPDAS